jgi:hypothetical protein
MKSTLFLMLGLTSLIFSKDLRKFFDRHCSRKLKKYSL